MVKAYDHEGSGETPEKCLSELLSKSIQSRAMPPPREDEKRMILMTKACALGTDQGFDALHINTESVGFDS